MKWESEYRSLLPGSPCSILCSPIFPTLPGTFSGYSHGSLGLQLCSSGSTLNLLSLYDDLIEELYCHIRWRTIQFSSVAQSCPILCNCMDSSTPAFPVHHQLPELTQTHVHHVGRDAIQPSHPLLSPSLPAFSVSQHQGLFQWVSSSHQVAKLLEFQHQSFQWIFRTDFL